MSYLTYKLIDPLTNCVFYVGKGVSKNRPLQQMSKSQKNRNLMGDNNPFYGKKHSEEAREKMRKARKNFLENTLLCQP